MNKMILFISIFLITLNIVNAANYYVKDPADCPATDGTNFPGQDCSPNDICGDISSIAQCYNTSTISIPSSYNAGYQTNVNTALASGYVLNCYATTTCVNKWYCDRDNTCYTTYNKETVCNSVSSTSCGACLSGYNDCDADGITCEIQNGAACTVGGVSGTYSGCSGSVGNCVVTKSYFQTGTLSSYFLQSLEDATLWFKEYNPSGWLIKINNSLNEQWGVNNDSCMVLKDGTEVCTASDLGTGGSFVNGSDITVNNLNVTQICLGGTCIINWEDICNSNGLLTLNGTDLTGNDGDNNRQFTSPNNLVTNKTIISVDNFMLQPTIDFTQVNDTITFINKIWNESQISIYIDSLSCALALNTSSNFTQSQADLLYYPLNSNPHGYINTSISSYNDSWINQTFYTMIEIDNLFTNVAKTNQINNFTQNQNIIGNLNVTNTINSTNIIAKTIYYADSGGYQTVDIIGNIDIY